MRPKREQSDNLSRAGRRGHFYLPRTAQDSSGALRRQSIDHGVPAENKPVERRRIMDMMERNEPSMRPRRLAALAATCVMAAAGNAAAAWPEPWQTNLQTPATPIMEQIFSLHSLLLWIIGLICLFVLALLVIACLRFREDRNPVPSRRSHNTLLEIMWTAVPVLILVGSVGFWDRAHVLSPELFLTLGIAVGLWGLALALRRPTLGGLALAFGAEAALLVVTLAWLFRKRRLTRLHWGWFVVLSLLGSLAFAVPVALLLPPRDRP